VRCSLVLSGRSLMMKRQTKNRLSFICSCRLSLVAWNHIRFRTPTFRACETFCRSLFMLRIPMLTSSSARLLSAPPMTPLAFPVLFADDTSPSAGARDLGKICRIVVDTRRPAASFPLSLYLSLLEGEGRRGVHLHTRNS